MKSLSLGFLLLLVAADGHAEWSFSATSSRVTGNTSYRLDANAVSPTNPSDIYPITSELVFPLNVWMAGLKADWAPTRGLWSVSASAAANASDPSRRMTDGDWERGQFVQYTESDAALKMQIIDLDARRRLIREGSIPISLVVNLGYQHIKQDITGYRGWYLDETLQTHVPIANTVPALTYDVKYVTGQAGLGLDAAVLSVVTIRAQSTAGAVFASDRDDHLLRGRTADGKAAGFESRSLLDLSRALFHTGNAMVSLGLRGEYRYIHANGTCTERWYRTEQTPEWTVPAGTTYAHIPHQFRSSQYVVEMRLGISL